MTIAIETTANAVWTAGADWQDAPTYVTAWIGTNFLGEASITAPELAEMNDTYTIASGLEIPFTITPAGGAAGDADDAFIARLGTGNISLALHSGDPGNAHTGNELTSARNTGYARVSVASRTIQK